MLELNLQMNIILLWVSHGRYSNDSAELFVGGKYSNDSAELFVVGKYSNDSAELFVVGK